jgi:hypothetical protein
MGARRRSYIRSVGSGVSVWLWFSRVLAGQEPAGVLKAPALLCVCA